MGKSVSGSAARGEFSETGLLEDPYGLWLKPHWQVAQAVKETAVWYQAWLEGKDMEAFTDEQIRKYFYFTGKKNRKRINVKKEEKYE